MREATTPTGTYPFNEFLPESARNLTIEQVLALLAYKIVSRPEAARLVVTNASRTCVVEFDVDPQDCGPMLGRGGYIISAIRTLAKAMLGSRVKDVNYRVELTPDSVPSRFANNF